LVVTDIVDSTIAIERGRHKSVNFVAALAIGALKNPLLPTSASTTRPCVSSSTARSTASTRSSGTSSNMRQAGRFATASMSRIAALMTCLVTSTADSLHVHFVDGGGGGYTNAAKKLKSPRPPAAAG